MQLAHPVFAQAVIVTADLAARERLQPRLETLLAEQIEGRARRRRQRLGRRAGGQQPALPPDHADGPVHGARHDPDCPDGVLGVHGVGGLVVATLLTLILYVTFYGGRSGEHQPRVQAVPVE